MQNNSFLHRKNVTPGVFLGADFDRDIKNSWYGVNRGPETGKINSTLLCLNSRAFYLRVRLVSLARNKFRHFFFQRKKGKRSTPVGLFAIKIQKQVERPTTSRAVDSTQRNTQSQVAAEVWVECGWPPVTSASAMVKIATELRLTVPSAPFWLQPLRIVSMRL